MNCVIKNEYYTLTLSTMGAEMISLKNASGRELLWQNTTGKGWSDHAPILFPLCGNIKNGISIYKGIEYPTKQHGFALRSEFTLIEKTETSAKLLLTSNEETKTHYPFDFSLTVTYSLVGDKVTFGATVKNTGSDVMPYSFGWHPGFVLFTDDGQDIEDYSIKFNDKKEVTWVHFYDNFDTPNDYLPYSVPNSEYKLCEEEIYKNDTMIFLGAGNEVKLVADGHPFELNMSWTDNLPVLCLWKAEKHESKFICIEPWTHDTIRGVNSNDLEIRDARKLSAGEEEYFEYNLKFKF